MEDKDAENPAPNPCEEMQLGTADPNDHRDNPPPKDSLSPTPFRCTKRPRLGRMEIGRASDAFEHQLKKRIERTKAKKKKKKKKAQKETDCLKKDAEAPNYTEETTDSSDSDDDFTTKRIMNRKQGIILVVILIVYLLFGGFVFMSLESKFEQSQRAEVVHKMQEVDYQLFQADKHNFTKESLRKVIEELAAARSLGLIDKFGNHTHNKWDLANSVFFAITVVTTIGYGHLYPATTFGRTFCVLYGVIGIPFTGILLASIGNHFSLQLMKALKRAKRLHSSKFAIFVNTLTVFVPWLLVFVFLPGGLFMILESWPYDVALYYSFVTLATIGFGDFVAATNNVEYIWVYKIMLSCWIIFGLGYLSTILNFIAYAMQSKKLKSVETRISKKFSQIKDVVMDNARSRSKKYTASRQRSNKSGKASKKHRRSRSLDFDATFDSRGTSYSSPKWHVKGIVDLVNEVSEESISIDADQYVPRQRRWFGILERNNNDDLSPSKTYKGSLSRQMKKSYSDNSPCGQLDRSVEVMDSRENVTSITDADEKDTYICIDVGVNTAAKDADADATPVTMESFIQTIEDAKATDL